MLRYFTEDEVECKCGCGTKPDPVFMVQLDEARHRAGIKFIVTGRLRCSAQQKRVNPKVKVTDHTGYGVDIRAHTSHQRHMILKAAYDVEFPRIGIYDKHIHLGMHPKLPQQVTWLGKSKK